MEFAEAIVPNPVVITLRRSEETLANIRQVSCLLLFDPKSSQGPVRGWRINGDMVEERKGGFNTGHSVNVGIE